MTAERNAVTPEFTPLKRAFLALEEARARIAALESGQREPIAIIGVGCRVPGADGPAAFWRLLESGTDATGDVPADRWDADAYYDADPEAEGRITSRRGGFLRDVDRFDAEFGKLRQKWLEVRVGEFERQDLGQFAAGFGEPVAEAFGSLCASGVVPRHPGRLLYAALAEHEPHAIGALPVAE